MGRTATRALSLRPIATLLNIFLLFGTATHAELINGNGRVIPGTEELTLFPGADLSGLNLFGLAAVDQQLSDASFEGTVLTGAEFARTNLTGANFEDAVVNSAYFDNLSPTQLYATANYKNQNLRAIQLFNPMVEPGAIWDFSGQDLDNAGLSGDFRGANFENANLVRTRFSGNYGLANWTNSNLRYARLGGEFPDTDFRGLNFQSALLVGNFPNSDFANANFTEATFRSGDFEQADFNGANINLAKLQGGSLSEEQVYSTANYRAGDLRGIEFERSFGDGIVGIAFDLSGWNLSNQNLSDVKFNLADLREANLREATLHRSRLGGANVTGADFENADMSFVQLGSEENFGGIVIIPTTSISESNFAGSRLLRGNLLGSEISDSSFTSADLAGADLRHAALRETDFTGARLQNASLEFADLEGVVFDSTTEFNEWTVFPSGFDPVAAGLTRIETIAGDFDASGRIDAADIDVLAARLRQTPDRWTLQENVTDRYWLFKDLRGATTVLVNDESQAVPANIAGTQITRTLGFDTPESLLKLVDVLKKEASEPDAWLEPLWDISGDDSVTMDDMDALLRLADAVPGDADLNGKIDFADFLALSKNYRRRGGWADGDFDGNGTINFPDFTKLSANFGKTTNAAAVVSVPEPSSLYWVLFSLLAGIRSTICVRPKEKHTANQSSKGDWGMRRFALLLNLILCSVAASQDVPDITTFEGGQHEINSEVKVVSLNDGAEVAIRSGADILVLDVADGGISLEDGKVGIIQVLNSSEATILGGETRSLRLSGQSKSVIRGGEFEGVIVLRDDATLDFFDGEVPLGLSMGGSDGAFTELPNRGSTLNVLGDGIRSVNVGFGGTLNLQAGSLESLFINERARVNVTGGSLNSLTLAGDSVVNFYGDDLRSETTQELGGALLNTIITGTLSDGTELNVTTSLLNDFDVNFLPAACAATISGDFNGDDVTNFSDFLKFASNFGNETSDPLAGDADCDGRVEFTDFLVISANFEGEVAEAHSVPEPATSVLAWSLLVLSALVRKNGRNRHTDLTLSPKE